MKLGMHCNRSRQGDSIVIERAFRYDLPMPRSPLSHKGENGKVAIIGGSRAIHGAPLFSALAAEASGVDLLYLFVPPVHEEVTKAQSLNFQVHSFEEDELADKDIEPILELLAIMDCVVIGPGLSREKDSLRALKEIIDSAQCPLVLDASALQRQTLGWATGKTAVLTPHLGELERMEIEPEDLTETAKKFGVTLLLKGPNDIIVHPDGTSRESVGGNAGLTVGGTGDALAGLIAGLIAQKMDPTEAAMLGSKIIKKAGERLSEEQGFSYTTKDVIEQIPFLLKELS